MKNFVVTLLTVAACATAIAEEADTKSLHQQAQALAQEFVGLLKPQLKRAMSESGPSHAISVCADFAPEIATSLSTESGWSVERVSLKSRNASRAVPDTWEQTVLLDFDRRQRAGEDASSLSFGEVVGGRYRYMHAQAVQPLCLTCHGKGLADTTTMTLGEYYPDDMATGYSLGQVRGAISLSKGL